MCFRSPKNSCTQTKQFSLLILTFMLACLTPLCTASPNADKRPVTVADSIRMTRVAGTGYPGVHPHNGFAVFSPDEKQFTFVIERGNPEDNTNVYSLLLFRSSLTSRTPAPRVLTSFASSSNREGIFNLTWANDNDTLFFLGSHGDETTQLYSIRCSSGQLVQLTHHSTSLVAYAVSAHDRTIVYSADKQAIDLINDSTLKRGISVTKEQLSDLITLHASDYALELFLNGGGSTSSKPLRTQNPFDSGINSIFLSPDGRYIVVKTDATELPEIWKEYEDPLIQTVFRRKLSKGVPTRILHYELIDTQTGVSKVLLDSPSTYDPLDVLWSPDSKSVLLCGTFLPLDISDPVERKSRRLNKFVVELSLAQGALTKITNEDLTPVRWDAHNVVQFRLRQDQYNGSRSSGYVYYCKIGSSWKRCMPDSDLANNNRPEIVAEQDLNTPPKIMAIDQKTRGRSILLDLNPQFSSLSFGKVEKIEWADNTGRPVMGGLYLPPDFKAGVKYPLVIQTHGFDPDGFSIDGGYPTAFSARPLASKGIVVLQMSDIFYDSLVTPQEPTRVMSSYENAIELLNKRGIIDPARVGIIGFSRTCFYVKYTLTHSRFHFAAAVAADGVDGGYLQYLIFSTPNGYASAEFDTIIGAPPFGNGLSLWLQRSPGFMLDKVQTPLLLQGLGAASLLGEWEWFSGLRRLGKPVDLLYLPTATHVLVQPWHRLASQGGAVDWICSWLKSEEDPDPAKGEQYRRWRELRDGLEHAAN
jgi:dipeptidyl aminopeptidase/acylaminoacyl peptidase